VDHLRARQILDPWDRELTAVAAVAVVAAAVAAAAVAAVAAVAAAVVGGAVGDYAACAVGVNQNTTSPRQSPLPGGRPSASRERAAGGCVEEASPLASHVGPSETAPAGVRRLRLARRACLLRRSAAGQLERTREAARRVEAAGD